MELPNNLEAERIVIGAALLSGSACSEAMQELSPADFFCNPYAQLFKAIGSLAIGGHPVNANTVAAEVATYAKPGEDGILPGFIYSTLEGVDPNDAHYWIEQVSKKRAERELVEFAEMARRVALSNPKDIRKARAGIEERLAKLAGGVNKDVVAMTNTTALEERVLRYETHPDSITGLETGWVEFDRMMDGAQPGNVTIVYAPSSRFKSMFIANVGHELAIRGAAGLWFTTEMPFLQVQERLLQIHTGLNFRSLRREGRMKDNKATIARGIAELHGLPIHICDSSELETGALRAMVNRYKKWHDIKYIIVDLVDMVGTAQFKDDSVAQQSAVMRQMKSIAKSSNVHIYLISHISKGEKQMYKQAFLSPEDMKGSSSKFQDVDCSISLMPVKVDPEEGRYVGLSLEELTNRIRGDGQVTLLVTFTKNRHGELGEIPFIVSIRNGGRIFPLARGMTALNRARVLAATPVASAADDTEYDDMDEEEFDAVVGLDEVA